MEPTVTFQQDTRCADCGRIGAYDFGEVCLCEECYEGRGSCCPEFGQQE